jgi:hypothetical protein
MGIPVKGSRTVSHEGKKFRYLVKETHIPDHRDQKEISVTVQEATPCPGRTLQARFGYGTSVSPHMVEKLIQLGLSKGWNPSARGAAFRLGNDPV